MANRPAQVLALRSGDRETLEGWLRSKEDIPKDGIVIDATKSLARVVDEIIRQTGK
jgi:hypothetical protein